MEESASEKIQDEINASMKNEHQGTKLVNEIKGILERLEPLLSPGCCIYKVPDPLRRLNEEAYTPQVISIGPFHHGNKKFETMEMYKMRYLKSFLERAETTLENLVSTIRDSEQSVRRCYADASPLSSDDFVKMVLVDSSFIIEFFLRNRLSRWTADDKTVLKPWLTVRMQVDLMLLENQLPFFIIEKLSELAFVTRPQYPSFIELTFDYFAFYNSQKMSPNPALEIMHFVDLLRTFHLPPRERRPGRSAKIVKQMYCASQLAEVGLKFKKSESTCILDIKFKNGALEIPCFTLDNATEIYARNLMALEQCHDPNDAYITDYFMLLDFLINTDKDVDLLGREGIVVIGLGDNNATFVNNLGTSIVYSAMNSDYFRLCEDLNQFYKDPLQDWKTSFRRDYFRTPCMAASTIAAVILLVLTSIQTVCSVTAC